MVERSAPADETELIEHVRATLAPYKAPRHILFVDAVMRGANGKLDYAAVKAAALAGVGANAK